MNYFDREYTDFFKGLSRNNKREWFQGKKKTYATHIKEPFAEFVGEIIRRIGKVEGEMGIEPKDAIFRISRDTRFSTDKTPYKTHMSAAIVRGARKNAGIPGFYFRFGAEGIAYAGGLYNPATVAVAKVRQAMLNDGASFARMLHAKTFKEVYGELAGEKYKRLPPEIAAVVDKWPFVAHKQFYYWAEYKDPRPIVSSDLVAFTMRHYRAGAKISAFLRQAVT